MTTPTPDRETCPKCDGKRVITVQVPDHAYSGGLPYLRSGNLVDRLYECSLCHGRGTVDHHTAELVRIDREKHEAEQAKYAALDAHHRDRIAAGLEPF